MVIFYLFPEILASFSIYIPAVLGVIAADKIANKVEEWKNILWAEALIFGFAFGCSFASSPFLLVVAAAGCIPTSFVGTLLIGYSIWIEKNEVEYCGKDRLHLYGVISYMIGIAFMTIRIFLF